MLKTTHVATTMTMGLTYFDIPYTMEPLKISLPVLCGMYLGSILPDIDHNNTKINKQSGWIGKILAKLGHRGITHCLLGWILISSPLLFLWLMPPTVYIAFLKYYWIGLSVGYLCHLIEDNFSTQGVLWLYPLTSFKTSANGKGHYKARRFHWYYYKVGGAGEKAIYRLMLILITLAILRYIWLYF